MTEIAMPKNALDDVMSSLRHLHAQPLQFFLNRPQKWSFWIMAGLGSGMVLFLLLFSLLQWPLLGTLTLLFALMVYVGAVVYYIVSMVTTFRLLLAPERAVLGPVIPSFNGELDLMARLVHTYAHRDLAYALDRLTLVVTQVRSRLAILIGALDKVGVIPLAVGAYFSFRTLVKEPLLIGIAPRSDLFSGCLWGK